MDFIKQYIAPIAFSISWLVTGFGWFITHRQAIQRDSQREDITEKRESRKEIKANIDRFINNLNELVKLSCDYYTSTENQDRNALDIQILIERCRRQFEDFQLLITLPKFESKFNDLFEAITGGDFGSDTRTIGKEQIEKCKRISILNGNVIEILEEWYKQEYPIK